MSLRYLFCPVTWGRIRVSGNRVKNVKSVLSKHRFLCAFTGPECGPWLFKIIFTSQLYFFNNGDTFKRGLICRNNLWKG